MNETKMAELTQAEDMAFFRADLCLYSPESYSLEEKKEICNDMMNTMLDELRDAGYALARVPSQAHRRPHAVRRTDGALRRQGEVSYLPAMLCAMARTSSGETSSLCLYQPVRSVSTPLDR